MTSAPSDEESDSDSDRDELIHSNRVHDDVLRERIDLFTRGNGDDYSEEIESEDDDNVSCNGNSDIQSLKEKVLTSCSCGKNCLDSVPLDDIQNSILALRELSREERDMFIMGKLSCNSNSCTQRGKERKRKRYTYFFRNKEICRGSFLFAYGVGSKYVKNIVSHMNENGCIPRTHKNKNRRLSNAFCFDDLKNAIDFIQNYAEEFGLPQPNVKNQGHPHIFLPSSGNKSSLHSTYVT